MSNTFIEIGGIDWGEADDEFLPEDVTVMLTAEQRQILEETEENPEAAENLLMAIREHIEDFHGYCIKDIDGWDDCEGIPATPFDCTTVGEKPYVIEVDVMSWEDHDENVNLPDGVVVQISRAQAEALDGLEEDEEKYLDTLGDILNAIDVHYGYKVLGIGGWDYSYKVPVVTAF